MKLRQPTKPRASLALLGLLLLLTGASRLQAQITETYTFTTNRVLPDGNAAGLSEVRTIGSAVANIASVKVKLKVTGEFNGDLYGYLRHGSGFTVLLNRPGRSASDAAGYDDSGLDVTFQAGAPSGDLHVYRNSVTPPVGSPLTGTWEPDGRTVDPASVTDASARTATLASFNGLDAAGEWTLYLADIESGGTNMLTAWELEITGAVYPTLAWSPADITYGTALGGAQLNATASHAGTNVVGTFSYLPAAGTILDSGNGQTLSVTFTPTDTSSFLATSTNATINVAKAPLTLTASAASRGYGDPNPVFTGAFTGLQNSDPLTDSYTCAATPASVVGTYPIVPTAGGVRLTNYTVTLVNGTLTVTNAPLTVTANDATRIFGAPNPAFSGVITGIKNSDAITATYGTAANASSPVGTYPIVPSPSGALLSNYTVTTNNGTLTVTTASSSAVLASSANPALPGASVTFTMTVSAVSPATGTPTGNVQFSIDGANVGSPVALNGAGAATYSTAALTHGTHTVSAAYAGDGNFTGASATLSPVQSINTPPVAGADTIERYPTQGVKVRLATLLANDSDADGDTLAIAVAGTSANGGTITVRGSWVFYTPATSFTGADSFTYTLTDGQGGSTTGTVTVALKVDVDPAQNLTVTDLGGGSFKIDGSGIPGRAYRLQYTASLTPATWLDLSGATVTANAAGVFTYTDTGVVSQRYYRSVYP